MGSTEQSKNDFDMKLLLNITCYHPDCSTGIERFASRITQEICNIDGAILVVSSTKISGVRNAIVSRLLAGVESAAKKYEYLFRAVWDQTCFRFIVARHRPDVLFFPIQEGLVYPPIRQIVTVHDLHYLSFEKSIPECRQEINSLRTKIYQYRMPHVLEHSAAVVAVSESTKREIVASFAINPDKIHVIYNGYDEERFHPVESPQPVLERYGLACGNYFLFVGSILKHKNIVRLIRAFALLERQYVLVIAGVCKDSEYLEEMNKVAEEVGISRDRLRYLAYVPDTDLPYLYSGAISYLLPSLHEGFGVPIIEAMACGTPVITSNITAMPEVAGDAALLVDPYSVESIATAMREVIDNAQLVKELKAAGLERAKMFRWSYSAQKLYELCQAVSGS